MPCFKGNQIFNHSSQISQNLYSNSETQPVRSKLMGTIPVQELSWRVTLDMVLLEPAVGDFYNVYHFTTGQKVGVHGSRTPAIWIYDHRRLLIHFNTDSDVNSRYCSDELITLNQKIRIIVEQVMVSDRPVVRIFIDQNMVHESPHNWKIPFKNVQCYLGDPWYPVAPVKVLYFNYEELKTL